MLKLRQLTHWLFSHSATHVPVLVVLIWLGTLLPAWFLPSNPFFMRRLLCTAALLCPLWLGSPIRLLWQHTMVSGTGFFLRYYTSRTVPILSFKRGCWGLLFWGSGVPLSRDLEGALYKFWLVEWNSTGKQALSHLTLGLFEEILRFCNGRQRTDADPILLGAKYMMILEFGSEGGCFMLILTIRVRVVLKLSYLGGCHNCNFQSEDSDSIIALWCM